MSRIKRTKTYLVVTPYEPTAKILHQRNFGESISDYHKLKKDSVI
jgi:hypothetical protein